MRIATFTFRSVPQRPGCAGVDKVTVEPPPERFKNAPMSVLAICPVERELATARYAERVLAHYDDLSAGRACAVRS
jgi:hypothetical protein